MENLCACFAIFFVEKCMLVSSLCLFFVDTSFGYQFPFVGNLLCIEGNKKNPQREIADFLF